MRERYKKMSTNYCSIFLFITHKNSGDNGEYEDESTVVARKIRDYLKDTQPVTLVR